MKKAAFRLTALVLALALCLLPVAAGAEVEAGAYWLDKNTLEFTVGEYTAEKFHIMKQDNAPDLKGYDLTGCINKKLGLWGAGKVQDGGGYYYVEGTPTEACDYIGQIKLSFWDGSEITLSILIKAREKETPVPPPPTVPTVVDNVIYNAAPEHEQALIRGVREWCNVRAGAGTDSAVIGRANLGQQISLLRWNADESWCFVEFNGLQGWIAKQFILPIQ